MDHVKYQRSFVNLSGRGLSRIIISAVTNNWISNASKMTNTVNVDIFALYIIFGDFTDFKIHENMYSAKVYPIKLNYYKIIQNPQI